jgi:hypothetical protein
MDFKISDDQKQFVAEIVQFAKENLNDGDLDSFSYPAWRKVAEFGLFGLNVGEEYGGLNDSYLTSTLAIEALGYACRNNGLVFAINNHIWVGLNLIHIYGSNTLKEKYLREMVEGKKIGAIAITEADSGSDAKSLKTNAKETKDDYILNGSKMFISNGTIADIFIVFAKIEGKDATTAFVIEKEFDGLSVGKDIEKMGLGGCPMAEVALTDCKVPKENVLGTVNSGDTIMSAGLEWERCYEFACHVGAMQRIMENCIGYASKRMQFGKPIIENQSVSHKIADMKMKIELAKLMLYKIGCLKDKNRSAYLETSIFKLFTSESYIKTCKDAMQIFGAYGYTREYGLEREMRDALACSIYSGTSEMQRNTIYKLAMLDVL